MLSKSSILKGMVAVGLTSYESNREPNLIAYLTNYLISVVCIVGTMGGTIGGTIGKHLSGPMRTNGFGVAFMWRWWDYWSRWTLVIILTHGTVAKVFIRDVLSHQIST